MSTIEMKKEIKEQLDKLSEKELSNVLDLINMIKANPNAEKEDMDLLFEKVVNKYGNVLQKLAQ